MGIFNKKQGGERCEVGEDGVIHCQTYEYDKEGKMATGTDFSFSVDPQTCVPTIIGNHDINDGDKERVGKKINQAVKSCRKGL